jgi:hypothetical protein
MQLPEPAANSSAVDAEGRLLQAISMAALQGSIAHRTRRMSLQGSTKTRAGPITA